MGDDWLLLLHIDGVLIHFVGVPAMGCSVHKHFHHVLLLKVDAAVKKPKTEALSQSKPPSKLVAQAFGSDVGVHVM